MRRHRRLLPLLFIVPAAIWFASLTVRRASTTAIAATPSTTAPVALDGPFPTPYNTEPDKSGPMPAADAAAQMRLPTGFNATVFASEPDVQNPIAMAWD